MFWSVKLKTLFILLSLNSDGWLYESAHFHVDYLLCIDPVKMWLIRVLGIPDRLGIDPFHMRDDSNPSGFR